MSTQTRACANKHGRARTSAITRACTHAPAQTRTHTDTHIRRTCALPRQRTHTHKKKPTRERFMHEKPPLGSCFQALKHAWKEAPGSTPGVCGSTPTAQGLRAAKFRRWLCNCTAQLLLSRRSNLNVLRDMQKRMKRARDLKRKLKPPVSCVALLQSLVVALGGHGSA
jgi:hypothetical protein